MISVATASPIVPTPQFARRNRKGAPAGVWTVKSLPNGKTFITTDDVGPPPTLYRTTYLEREAHSLVASLPVFIGAWELAEFIAHYANHGRDLIRAAERGEAVQPSALAEWRALLDGAVGGEWKMRLNGNKFHAAITSTEGPEARNADDHLVIAHVQYGTYSDVEGMANFVVNARRDAGTLLDIIEGFGAPAVVHVPLYNAAGAIETSALIDADEWSSVSRFKWRLTAEGAVNEHGGTLARFILCPNHDQDIVHANGSDIDCRRSNMKIVDCEPLTVHLPMKLRAQLENAVAIEGVTVSAVIARLIAGGRHAAR